MCFSVCHCSTGGKHCFSKCSEGIAWFPPPSSSFDKKCVQADVATAPPGVPEIDFNALAKDLDKKSPLEIMDHVGFPWPLPCVC